MEIRAPFSPLIAPKWRAVVGVLSGLLLAQAVMAAPTPLASAPLVTATSEVLEPNLLFVLDDSGSMAWSHMPDDSGDAGSSVSFVFGFYGARSSHCNGVYYDPNFKYLPPVTHDGISYSPASFTSAYRDGFANSGGPDNLSTSFRAIIGEPSNSGLYNEWDASPGEPAYYYRYIGSQTTEAQKKFHDSASTFFQECGSAQGVAPGNLVFQKVVVSSTSGPGATDERANFANWYSYYRTRMLTMKSGVGHAFKTLTSRYRVGFMAMNANNRFLNLDVFKDDQRKNWYSMLYGNPATGGTPLREALVKAGRFYGGKLSMINDVPTVDPIKYSCQQNFTILSTDGYWNGNGTPYQLNGSSAIGDQDGAAARPLLDGNATANTLADVAKYYYDTDLRTTGAFADPNNVRGAGADIAQHQHMTTYTLGLGARGLMVFNSDYNNPLLTTGDFYAVKTGQTASASVCTWQAAGTTCNWPAPGMVGADGKLSNIDDLWHAAVNGRGEYFSAANPGGLAVGLATALNAMEETDGSSSSATTSSPNISAGEDFIFETTFTTSEWSGNLERRALNVATGEISALITWSARTRLDVDYLVSASARKVYTRDPGDASDYLKEFKWAGLSAAEQAHFDTAKTNLLSQNCTGHVSCLNDAAKGLLPGENLVNFLRGDVINTGPDETKPYRRRASILGDIVNSEAVYVKKVPFNYQDADFANFKTGKAGRKGMVYVPANDGMLHAFESDTGKEAWAYVPNFVMPNLYKLADKNYKKNHEFFLDGSPTMGSANIGGWKTILVGGQNAGGRNYYALDVTDPDNPKSLWEFSHANMGYSYGRPLITKLNDGTWVVLLTSGYNNNFDVDGDGVVDAGVDGDGKGHVFVVDAATGALIRDIATTEGTTTDPSGLAQISAWVDDMDQDNTTLRVYGGDLLGNVWRFDINGGSAHLLATLKGPDSMGQPITTRPELGQVDDKVMVYIGTGRLLHGSDVASTQIQTMYGIKDKLDATTYSNARSSGFIPQTLVAGTCPSNVRICNAGKSVMTVTSNVVNLAVDNGWYIDLLVGGERFNTTPLLNRGVLVLVSNTPGKSACNPGGSSSVYFLDYATGGAAEGSKGVAGFILSSTSMATGAVNSIVGKISNKYYIRKAGKKIDIDAGHPNDDADDGGACKEGATMTSECEGLGGRDGNSRRISWRELVNE